MTPVSDPLVVVTGANGFVASHCIVKLLDAGYRVRGTIRDLSRAEELLELFERHAIARDGVAARLNFVQAGLESNAGWSEALIGADYVFHVASPVPKTLPLRAEDVIDPARSGTLRVLRKASEARVRRVVITSSTSAVFSGHARDGSQVYDERDWSVLSARVGAYEQSKTLAEAAAWAYVQAQPDASRLELVTINPGVVLGPLLGQHASVSGEIVRKLLAREIPGCPELGWAIVDVRDVADAHLAALTVQEANGQRFIVALEHASMLDIAQLLAKHFRSQGFQVPVRRLPGWVLRLVGLVDKTVALTVSELGKRQDVSSRRARAVLGWQPRSLEETVVDTATSMIAANLVAPPLRHRRLRRRGTHWPGTSVT